MTCRACWYFVISDDIMVRFVEQDKEGNILWEAYGHFGPFDVHRQVVTTIPHSFKNIYQINPHYTISTEG